MEDIRSLPEYQVAPPPPNLPENGGDIPHPSAHPPIQLYHHTTALNHAQQPLSYSLYQAIPGYEYSQYALARTVSAHVLQDPYALQGGVAGYGGYAIAAAPHPHSGAGHLDPAPYAPGVVVGGTSGETYDHGGADIRTHAWKEAIRLYGGNPSKSNHSGNPNIYNGDGLGTSFPLHSIPPYQEVPRKQEINKNKKKKNIKIVQSAFCEVCKVDCNSQEVLNSHKQGQKHKKNLQKLQKSITPKPTKAPMTAAAGAAEIARLGKENTERNNNKRKREEDDLETKRIKLIEAGAKAAGVRACTICNIVVNSLKVYESHLAGQKHQAMVEKLQEAQDGSIAR